MTESVYVTDEDFDDCSVWYIPNEEGKVLDYADVLHGHGIIHKYDGPAMFYEDRCGWWIKGNRVDEEDYKDWLIEMEMDIDNLTPEDKILIDLKWGKE